MDQLKKQLAFERRWLDELRGSYGARIKKKVAELRRELAAMRAIVNDSEQIPWGAQRVAEFKKNHPRFMRSEARGFETATLR